MIRSALSADQAAFASLVRERELESPARAIAPEQTVRIDGTLVADQGGSVEGYVRFERIGAVGYVRELVVAERAHRDETCTALMRAAAAELRASEVREWLVDVRADETAAIDVCEALGLRAEHRSAALRVPWSVLAELPDEPVAVLPVSAAEEDDIERALGLLAGQIEMARGRPGQVLRQLRDDDCAAVGFAAFDPGLPCARIFRVARPTCAASLIAALRAYARHDHLALVIEDDDVLTDLLLAHGAHVKRRLLHLRGPIPSGDS